MDVNRRKAMPALDQFSIRRIDGDAWDYVVEIVTGDGGKLQLTASVEDLDRMSVAIDDQLAVMVEAAERLGLEKYR
jgi:hypothetical protein